MLETQKIKGYLRASHVCKTKSGLIVPLDPSFIARKDVNPCDVSKWNLVVNSGRENMARTLGGSYQTADPPQIAPYINRITLGEGVKSGNAPSLSDTGLIQEIRKIGGTPSGTFLLNGPNEVSPDITFPAAAQRWPLSGDFTGANATITIDGDGKTFLDDPTVLFISTINVQLTDQVTLNNSVTNPLVLGIKEVVSETRLELHNPYSFTGVSLEYRVSTPGTQMLVSKLIEGNNFPNAEWGEGVLISEAALLYNNSELFNRVIYYPEDEEKGLLLQSDESTGVEVSVRFEWLMTL